MRIIYSVCFTFLAIVLGLASPSMAAADAVDEDVLELNISCYVDGELYSMSTMEASPGSMGVSACGSREGGAEFWCSFRFGEPHGDDEWFKQQLAMYEGRMQHVSFCGIDFLFHSPIADRYEIEVRGCKRSDLVPYAAVMQMDTGLDDSIKNKLFRPLGSISIAATRFDPVPQSG